MTKVIERGTLLEIFEKMNEINKKKPSKEELTELAKVLNQSQEDTDESK